MTKQTDYAIVLMSQIAESGGARHTASALAADTLLPQPMVSKILKLLAKAGLLESHRGAKGGYTLAQAPRDVTVAGIIAALEGPISITECTSDVPHECSYEASCRVRGNWRRINDAVRKALESITLDDIVLSTPKGPAHSTQLIGLG
ncbi:MAG: SUF system Fe-S cluster assembly regulator [Acidobacteriota bacterium]